MPAGDWIAVWLPTGLLVAVLVVLGARQMREYRRHLEEVSRLNREAAELSRRNHEIAQAQLQALMKIQTLLENGKS
jgi:heme exporter protein D